MDKPKQRGENKPKSVSPSKQEKRIADANRAKNVAEHGKHTGGAKPAPLLRGPTKGGGKKNIVSRKERWPKRGARGSKKA